MRSLLCVLFTYSLIVLPSPVRAQCIFGLGSCYPSEANAKAVADAMMRHKFSKVPWQMTSFTKVNSKNAEVFGVKVHVIEAQWEVVLPEGLNPECIPNKGGQGSYNMTCFMRMSEGFYPRGHRLQFKNEIVFEKTEKGWKGQDGRLY